MISNGIKCLAKTPLPVMLALLMVAMPVSCAAPPALPEEPTPLPPEQPPAPAITLNPVEEYAKSLGLSDNLVSMLKPLGEDGIMGYAEKDLIDELGILPTEVRTDAKTLSILEDITKDGKVTYDEFETRFQDLDQDGAKNSDELSVYQTNPLVAETWNDFVTVVKILNTPEKVSNYMKNKIRYEGEPPGQNIPQDALTTFTKKSGDCEDHAMFATYILLKNGYAYNDFGHHITDAACILDVQWGQIGEPVALGHAVCLYKLDGQFFYLDNCGYKKGPFSSVIDVVNNISPGWKLHQFINDTWKITKRVTK